MILKAKKNKGLNRETEPNGFGIKWPRRKNKKKKRDLDDEEILRNNAQDLRSQSTEGCRDLGGGVEKLRN